MTLTLTMLFDQQPHISNQVMKQRGTIHYICMKQMIQKHMLSNDISVMVRPWPTSGQMLIQRKNNLT